MGANSHTNYALLPIGCMVAPFFAGQLADRFMPTDRLLALLHLACVVPAYVMASAQNYDGVWFWMLLWALLYGPTLALTNSICGCFAATSSVAE